VSLSLSLSNLSFYQGLKVFFWVSLNEVGEQVFGFLGSFFSLLFATTLSSTSYLTVEEVKG